MPNQFYVAPAGDFTPVLGGLSNLSKQYEAQDKEAEAKAKKAEAAKVFQSGDKNAISAFIASNPEYAKVYKGMQTNALNDRKIGIQERNMNLEEQQFKQKQEQFKQKEMLTASFRNLVTNGTPEQINDFALKYPDIAKKYGFKYETKDAKQAAFLNAGFVKALTDPDNAINILTSMKARLTEAGGHEQDIADIDARIKRFEEDPAQAAKNLRAYVAMNTDKDQYKNIAGVNGWDDGGVEAKEEYIPTSAKEAIYWDNHPDEAEAAGMVKVDGIWMKASDYENATNEKKLAEEKKAKNKQEADRKQSRNLVELKSTQHSMNTLLDTIDKASKATGQLSTGLFGDVAGVFGFTNAAELSGYIDTLKANLAFDRLQEMRDKSKTGGALGQVSDRELKLLSSAVANLDPKNPKYFLGQLSVVNSRYEKILDAIEEEIQLIESESGKQATPQLPSSVQKAMGISTTNNQSADKPTNLLSKYGAK